MSLGDTSHSRCESNFKQAVGIGKHHVIRTRTPSACLQFIFSSLAHPPTGTPTHNDVLDILCRVRYPTRTAAKGQLRCKPVEQLSSLVERLEPTTQRSLTETLSASTMQELGLSVEAFPSPYRRLVTEPNMQIGGGVNAEQFEEWALQVGIWAGYDHILYLLSAGAISRYTESGLRSPLHQVPILRGTLRLRNNPLRVY